MMGRFLEDSATVQLSGLSEGAPFLIAAMMTRSHVHYGSRLAASCRARSLPLLLAEVPAVHRSVSTGGSSDPSLTKANFIREVLERFRLPVLYMDVDCVVVERPARIEQLLAAKADFAIFNWLAEEHTEAYVPAEADLLGEADARGEEQSSPRARRYYRFSHSIDTSSDTQLLCSGAVQLYNHTPVARMLLERWQTVIERAVGRADDKCLDYAVNNFPKDAPPLRAAWLPKSYARYAWWIYERPIIDHPQVPAPGTGFTQLDELDGRRRIYAHALRHHAVEYVFPKDCLIDTHGRTLLRSDSRGWYPVAPFSTPLWI